MEFKIATNSDLKTVARLRWDFKIEEGQTAAVDRDHFERQCLSQLQSQTDLWSHFLAWDESHAIGMVSICKVPKVLSPSMTAKSIGYVTNTYIEASRRGDGIGEALMKTAIAWAKGQGFELLFVWPSERSRAFYNRLGFQAENDIMELLF